MRAPLYLRVAVATLTTVSLLSPAVATAGPDDGKIIATQTHIDAPKTFRENDTFSLKTNLGGGNVAPLEDTAVWVGKGWAATGANQYQLTVPEDPKLSFLGNPGDVVYAAPINIFGNHDPVWLGFGADAALPADTFRDRTASLDLVSAGGPGLVDMFTWYDDSAGLHRILSSADDGPRSAYLSAGTHTHNYTTFTRPGRYELTTLPIQVGGAKPADKPTAETRERYDSAPAGDLAGAGYSLSVAPYDGSKRDGDEHLTTVTFAAADTTLSGTLTLFNNGYLLTDLPVSGGTATWNELRGAQDSALQAVFTPDGATGARWISPELAYTPGAEARGPRQRAAATTPSRATTPPTRPSTPPAAPRATWPTP
ncbi:choice-of-anchor M domain-containing protein [uncultured Corynebacterium sp.]|uniref:choice-of-anchor M domain-containing protein n=1 Tax=uncultured Corynebacterium sp. TaxID=159447 RepID=UPI002596F2CD|nr:choice-of-anchor M domain-containing protein [uncultured Corynebacterium sp.]